MIEYLRGDLAELTPTTAVIDCMGVGYILSISLNTYTSLQDKKECKLFVHEAIRDDAYQLFGFINKEERELFLLLNSVSGIGGNTARMILSAFSPYELVETIGNENSKLLQSVKGIGKRTAERIIVELKDKIKATNLITEPGTGNTPKTTSSNMEVYEEAVTALTMLGFAPHPTQKVVKKILQDNPILTVEQVIKHALQNL